MYWEARSRAVMAVAACMVALGCHGAACAQGAAPSTVMLFEQPVYQQGGVGRLSNGNFESGMSGWTVSGAAAIETTGGNVGSKCLRLGEGEGSASAAVTLPGTATAESATLSFWYRANARSLAPVICTIRDTATQTELISPLSTSISVGEWTRVTVDISTFLGRQVDVLFRSRTVSVGGGTQRSTLWLDGVTVATDEDVWVSPSTHLWLIARDLQGNLDYTQYRFGTGGLFTDYTGAFQLPPGMPLARTVQYRSVDKTFAAETIVTRPLLLNPYQPTSLLRFNQPFRLAGGTVIDQADFESGFDGYSATGPILYANNAKSGELCLLLRNDTVRVSKSVAIPGAADRAVLSIWYHYQQGSAGQGFVWVQAPVAGATVMLKSLTQTTNGWNEMLLDVSSWKSSTLKLTIGVDNPSNDTSLFIDYIRFLKDATVYVSPASDVEMLTGSLLPVHTMEASINGGDWISAAFDAFNVSGSGVTPLAYAATDVMGWREYGDLGVETQVYVDGDGPAASIAINGGAPFTESASVMLNLAATDINGVDSMRFRNSTGLFSAWEDFASTKSLTLAGSSPGERTVIAQFRDLLGNVSEVSDTIETISPQQYPSIGAAKQGGPYPLPVRLTGRRITGVFAARQYAYIQDPDRAAGIKVNTSSVGVSGLFAGRDIDVSGAIRLDPNNEPELFLTGFSASGASLPLRPLAMHQRGLGGGAFGAGIPGVKLGTGLHSVGQLIRTSGRVAFRDFGKSRFRLDGGSPGGPWVDLNGAPMPGAAAFVSVVGNLGAVVENSETLPIVRLRSSSDLTVH